MEETLIGLTCEKRDNKLLVSNDVLTAIAQLGAVGVPIPYCLSDEDLRRCLNRCHGFVFCGGGDIHPSFYGGTMPADNKNICFERDVLEKKIFDTVLPLEKPILGICRGMQAINVFLGGSLKQVIKGHFQLLPRNACSHNVKLRPHGILVNVANNTFHPSIVPVNSFHRQCVDKLADDLTIEASADDGAIEAISLAHHRFLLGVQWHPECTFNEEKLSRSVFKVFVDTCKHRS